MASSGFPLSIPLPDFDELQKEVAKEIYERVVRRTPRSNLDKPHLQDAWELIDYNKIKNDKPYAGFVEGGTSKMAGAHMVSTTMEEVPDIIEAALKKAQPKE